MSGGLLTRAVLRGGRFRRVFPDVYAPAAETADLELRSRAAYVWGRRWDGVLGGYSACVLQAVDCAPSDAPPELILRRSHRHPPAGLWLRQDELAADEVRLVRGMEVTTGERTAYDLARREPLTEAVVAVDSLCARFGFPPTELLEFARRYPRARGARRPPRVVALADPRAESPMESRLRLLLVAAGLPCPCVQYPVRDRSGRVVATVDLAYPTERIAIEYEGGEHFTPERGSRDVYRRAAEVVAEVARALGGFTVSGC